MLKNISSYKEPALANVMLLSRIMGKFLLDIVTLTYLEDCRL